MLFGEKNDLSQNYNLSDLSIWTYDKATCQCLTFHDSCYTYEDRFHTFGLTDTVCKAIDRKKGHNRAAIGQCPLFQY